MTSTLGSSASGTDLRSEAASTERTLAGERSSASDPNEIALLDDLRQMVQTKVALRRLPNGSGRIEIEFYSTDDLARILETVLAIR